ncbi:hypothetical protein B0H10DRAFT_1912544, partial [Mycena sp. CBHHK59/15]
MTYKFTEYFSIISDTLETISVELPIFQDYIGKLYPESLTVQKAVSAVCKDILSVFIAVRKAFVDRKGHIRSSFSITVRAFHQNMDKIISDLEKHRKVIQVHAQHAERLAIRENQDRTAQIQKDLEAKILSDSQRESEIVFYARIEKLRALLAAPHCWEKHGKSLAIYKQPQCWLLDSPQYQHWCYKSNGLLWCHAKPGAGKTVLSSVIINNLQQKAHFNHDITVTFFYCEYDDPLKRQPAKIIASILDQLLYNPETLASVKAAWTNGNPNLQHLGLKQLQDLVIHLLQQSQHTYIIVDALDESEAPGDLADILKVLATYASVLVTSRTNSEDIAAALVDCPQIHISPSNIQDDIEYFVTTALAKHRRLAKRPPEIKENISKVLLTVADGMFLWVTLMIEILGNQVTDHDITCALEQLPIGLSATYCRILTEIDKLPSREWSRRAITWILCARRPLNVLELVNAISVDNMDELTGWDLNRVPTDAQDVIFDCKDLITCTPTSKGTIAQFIHPSVQDFLLSDPTQVMPTVPHYHIFPPRTGHSLVAKWCLIYLVIHAKTKSTELWKHGPHLDLLSYVKTYWNTHMQESQDQDLLTLFKRVTSNTDVIDSLGKGSSLHVALKYNISFLVAHLLQEKFDLHILDVNQNTILHLAVTNPLWIQALVSQKPDIH